MWQLAIAAVALLFVHWFMKRKQHFNFFKKCGIPGPPPSIIFGNIMEMYRKTPTKAYREWIDKYGDVVGYFNGYRPVILVADLDLLRDIQVKDFPDFTDRALLFQAKRPPSPQNKGLLQLTSTRWKEVRSVLTPSFTTSKLKMMSPGIISAVEKLVSNIDRKACTGEEFEASDMYAALALDVICKSALGIDFNLQDQPHHGFLIFCKQLFGCAFSFIAVVLTAFPAWDSGLRFINSRWLRYQNGGVHPFIDVQEKCKRIVMQRQEDTSLRQKDLLQLMIDAKDSRVDLGSVTSTQLTAAEDNDQELSKGALGGVTKDSFSCFKKAVLDDDDITQNAFVVLVGGALPPVELTCAFLESRARSDMAMPRKKAVRTTEEAAALRKARLAAKRERQRQRRRDPQFETTSNTMSLVTHMMIHYPEVQEKVREELLSVLKPEETITYSTIQNLPYMTSVILETMRLYPPAFAIVTREAVVDKQYGKMRIPAGTAVMAAAEYIHRDPRHWENPDRFDPERFLPENKSRVNTMAMQAFGNGPRNCIGMRFAHMELRYTFAHILRKYRLEKTENSEKDPPSIDINPMVLKIKGGVKVRAVPLGSSVSSEN